MKNLFFKILTVFSFPLFMLTSCDDPIFSSIREEIELEDADVSGAIYSIVRYKNDIYVQNGKIYKKSLSKDEAHGWTEVDRPKKIYSDYVYVNKLAADANYLYAQITKINEDDVEGENRSRGSEIWCYDGNAWAPVTVGNCQISGKPAGSLYGAYTSFSPKETVNLFCTNSEDPSQRLAFVHLNGIGFLLNGTKTTEDLRAAGNCVVAGDIKDVNNLYFNDSRAMISNKANDFFYIADGERLRYGTKAELAALKKTESTSKKPVYSDLKGSFNVGSTIYSLALTSDYLLVGCYSGLKIFKLKTDKTPDNSDESHSFKNTSSTLSSYYRVHVVFTVDSSKELVNSSTYATADYSGSSSTTSASTKNRGLWAYLSTVRKNWNRE